MLALTLLDSCSSSRVLGEDEYLLDKIDVTPRQYGSYIRQTPNHKWFGAVKVPLGIYLMAGKGEGRFKNMIRRVGEAPVVYDSLLDERTLQNLRIAAHNEGYLNASASRQIQYNRHKVRLHYNVERGELYYVTAIHTDIRDSLLTSSIERHLSGTLLHEGMPFDAEILSDERSRIANTLQNEGYYHFTKENIHFVADTTMGNHSVDLTMIVGRAPGETNYELSHRQYDWDTTVFVVDTLSRHTARFRPNVLRSAVFMKKGTRYNEEDLQDTYSRLMQLGAIAASNIHLEETDSDKLSPRIQIVPQRINNIRFNIDGTNNAGDLGAALELAYQNRNLFHGSELLTIKLRGAYEMVRNLKGYEKQNYMEASAEVALAFPDFKFPFVSKDFMRSVQARSEVSLKFDTQDRPEFHRQVVTAAWRYRWSPYGKKHNYRWDLLNLNYVYMPWISETFRAAYLDNPSSRNAILRYNYENLFILNWSFTYNFSSVGASGAQSIYGKDAYTVRLHAETAGNLLQGICTAADSRKNVDNQRTLFGIAFAQYAKLDFDFARSVRFSQRHSMAFHFALGIAYPYGNSTILPYEKRYFSGGANSVRGWSVRELGPGSFLGNDGRIDFINQTGDLKLDMSVEYRAHIVWKLDGALFVDAGNIWTLRNYEDQRGGQFRFDTFARQIAVSYGAGLRLNFNFFILRFDMAMKAINPAFAQKEYHYAIAYPNFKRDFTFHFAVGLPF